MDRLEQEVIEHHFSYNAMREKPLELHHRRDHHTAVVTTATSAGLSNAFMRELGLLLCNLVTVVPEGILVFFPSFDYKVKCMKPGNLLGFTRRKHIFREPRNNMDVESFLKEYKDTICALSSMSREENQASHSGAVLLAVVCGKISEGINLSDGMGRCVVMVGMPNASPSDIELLGMIKHIEGFRNSKSIENT
ncbi:hypothetical protein PIB30_088915 [Stylosanthes scabra]|uniref:ATP-dependent helicase C-terminal domain-containing protein n=1 Tax=Stylosanthes scabra TaxID=79078 RepID=A0ABU6ZSJ4_9FABA|nr:hypothetical protein [Stylosanthes scabra]